MPAPSPLAIATSSVTRLTKEDSSYRTELLSQQKRLQSLEASTAPDEEGNRDFQIEQEVRPRLLAPPAGSLLLMSSPMLRWLGPRNEP